MLYPYVKKRKESGRTWQIRYIYFWTVITVIKGKWALRHGRNTNSLLESEAFDGDVLAIRMSLA